MTDLGQSRTNVLSKKSYFLCLFENSQISITPDDRMRAQTSSAHPPKLIEILRENTPKIHRHKKMQEKLCFWKRGKR